MTITTEVRASAESLLNTVDQFLSQNEALGNSYLRDLLSYLASHMVTLNKLRQEEAKNFAASLSQPPKLVSSKGGVAMERLSSKQVLKLFVGDSRANQETVSFEQVWEALQQNGKQLSITLDPALKPSVRHQFEKSRSVLEPIERQLAVTDWLIDQLVYRIYRLSPTEVELIQSDAGN